MHYCGFVIVEEPTEEAVAEALAPFDQHTSENGRWDWYVIGGRWRGFFAVEDETKSNDQGDEYTSSLDGNYLRCAEVPEDRRNIYFLLCDGMWLEKKVYAADPPRMVETPGFNEFVSDVLKRYPDRYVVVVDCHN